MTFAPDPSPNTCPVTTPCILGISQTASSALASRGAFHATLGNSTRVNKGSSGLLFAVLEVVPGSPYNLNASVTGQCQNWWWMVPGRPHLVHSGHGTRPGASAAASIVPWTLWIGHCVELARRLGDLLPKLLMGGLVNELGTELGAQPEHMEAPHVGLPVSRALAHPTNAV